VVWIGEGAFEGGLWYLIFVEPINELLPFGWEDLLSEVVFLFFAD